MAVGLGAYQYYEGNAFVLFLKNGQLYEVNGSHCSCYGLEAKNYYGSTTSQWEPEETSVESLLKRLNEGKLGLNDYNVNSFANELREVIQNINN